VSALRTARRDDLAAVVAVMTAVDLATLGEPDSTEEDIVNGWDESGFDVEADAFVAEDPASVVIGYAELYDRGEGGYFDADVYAHPDAPDELAGALLDAVLERAALRAGPGSTLSTWVPEGDRLEGVYASRAFAPARQFVRMRFTATAPVPVPPDPPGVTMRTFDRTRDAAAAHLVLVDAFAHHARPMTPSLERFTEQHLDHPDFDPRYWAVAEVDGTIVGAINAFNHGDIGFIRHVGVRDGFRGRGIGRALVLRSLAALTAAGQFAVDLGVDLDDDVGAVRLYEALGFTVLQRLQLVERRL
jgi:mycothiol synthase